MTDAEVKQDVADILKVEVADLEAFWDRLITKAVGTGYTDVKGILLGRGYTMGQLDTWDDRNKFNRQQSLFWLYTESSLGIGYDDKEINKLDRRKELADITIMINDIPVPPGAVGDASTLGTGVIDESCYRINGSTEF